MAPSAGTLLDAQQKSPYLRSRAQAQIQHLTRVSSYKEIVGG
jgi:hypothetical protein